MSKVFKEFGTMDLMNGNTAVYLVPYFIENPQPVIIDASMLVKMVEALGDISKEELDDKIQAVLKQIPPNRADLAIQCLVDAEMQMAQHNLFMKFVNAYKSDCIVAQMMSQIANVAKKFGFKVEQND